MGKTKHIKNLLKNQTKLAGGAADSQLELKQPAIAPSPSALYPATTLEISHSTLVSFDSCARKLEFAKLFGFNMRDRSKATAGGQALHSATGVYILTKDKQAAILKLLLEYPIDLCSNPFWSWSLEASYAALLSIMQFLDQHTELEIASIDGKPAIEVPFLINIDHKIPSLMPVVYRGYIDFVFYNRIDDYYFVLDLKTTAANTKDFTPVYRWDSQCLPYAVVLNKVLNKDIKNLEVQYLVAKVDIANPSTTLLMFEKSESEIQEWARDVYMKLFAVSIYVETAWFPRNSKSCVAYNRTCRYFDLCNSRNIKTLKLMLQSMPQQEKKPFDPWITLDLELN